MKILSVEITNITSIEGPYLINFEDDLFSNIGLFGITGPVGAGKSSIIDAICLGLYNTTPRLDRSTSGTSIQYEAESVTTNNSQNLLRRGAGSGSVVVRFKAIDDQIWQSTWLLRRARDLANGKLQNVTMILFNETLNETFPDNKITKIQEKIKTLIGLDFKQFTKSVILAQGDFQAFLNASDTDRAQILEKLTGTEIYSEISKSIFEKNNKIKLDFQQIDTQIKSLHLLTEDEITNLEKSINETEQNILVLKKNVEQLKLAENWYVTQANYTNESLKIEQELNAAKSTLESMSAEIVLLKSVEKIQEIKPHLIENKKLENDSNILNRGIEDLEKAKHLYTQQLVATEVDLNHEIQNKKNIQLQIQTNEPLYKKARELDILLYNSKKKLNDFTLKLNQKTNEIEENKNQINLKNEAKKEIDSQINKINSWFTSNPLVKNWAENHSLIQNQFEQFEQTNSQIEALLSTYNTSKKFYTDNQKKLIDATDNQLAINTALNKILDEINVRKNEIQHQDLEQSLKNQQKTNQNLSALKDIKQLATSFIKNKTTISKIISDHNLNEKNLKTEKANLKQIISSLTNNQNQIEKQRFYVDKLKLESSQNVLHLRSQLQPGCECPVCGSTDHKLENVAVLNNILHQAETDLKLLETTEKDFLSAKSKHQTNEINLTEVLNQLTIKLNEIELEQKVLIQQWENINISNISLHITQTNVIEEIDLAIKQKQNESDYFNQIIQHTTTVQKIIEQNELAVAQHEVSLKQINEQLTQLKIEEQNLKNKLDQITVDGEKNREQQKQIENNLTKIINLPNWTQLFKENAIEFKASIFNQINIWNTNIKKLDDLNQNSNLTANNIITFETLLKEKIKEQQDILIQKDIENKLFESQNFERKLLFEGNNVDDIEQKLKIELTNNEQKINDLVTKIQQIKVETTKVETSANNKNQHIISNKQNIEKNNTAINKFIVQYNIQNGQELNFDKLTKLCDYTHDWVENSRANFEKQQKQISNLEGAHKTIQKQIKTHLENQPSKQSLEEIAVLKSELENNLGVFNDTLIVEKGKQLNHINNIKSQTNLLNKRDELLPDYIEWNELNDWLGSATGDKLKKFAQQFTLDLLLQTANAQLQQINNRYILERIDDTLSILVIDQYMANSKRATNSLSGGETFLVSLALSLALSTISSTQLKVESLFIDEGFGNLDPNSLETAFLALENLQNQGRMVGIISHLDSVIDRLTVKIEVTPQGNGKSKIQIVA